MTRSIAAIFVLLGLLGLSAPAGAQDAPSAPAVTVKATHGDWEVKCINGTKECQIYQLIKDPEGNPVAEISLFKLPGGQAAVAGANVVSPLETLLTEQLTIEFDDENAKKYPFSFCTRIGCVARIGLTAEEIAIFKANATSKIIVVHIAAPTDPLELTLSLKGFTKAFNAI